MNLASRTPPAVPKLKATTPMSMILMVWRDRKVVPVAVRAADDADGAGFRAGEAHETAAHEGDEDAQLGGRAQ